MQGVGGRLTRQCAAGARDPCVDREEVLGLPCPVSLCSLPPGDSVETVHPCTPGPRGSAAGRQLCLPHIQAASCVATTLAVASASQGVPVSPEPPAVRSPGKLSGKLLTC